MHDQSNGHLTRKHASHWFTTLLLLALCGCGGGGGGNTPSSPPPTYGRFAYVANFADDTVSIYIADNSSGQLRHNGYAVTGDGPRQVVIHPSGLYAYTTNYNAQTISLFTIDSLAGGLTAAACDGGANDCAAGGSPVALAFGASGKYAYVANDLTPSISVFDASAGVMNSYIQNIATGFNGPVSLRPHPNVQVLYLTHQGSDNVAIYEINASDGTLAESASSPVLSGGAGPTDMLISSDGMHAYVANQTSDNIGVFDVDSAGGLTANGAAIASGGSPRALVIDQSGSWLYAVNADASGTVSLFSVQSDGTLSKINCSGATADCPVGGSPEAIALDPTGQFITVTNGDDDTLNVFTINQSTGELSARRTLAARDAPGSVAYLSDTSAVTITPRFAYVANENSNDVSTFSINADSGALSTVGTLVATAGTAPSSVAVDPTGRFAYVTNRTSHSISAFAINPSSGALSTIGTPVDTTGLGTQSVAIDPSGNFLYAANTSSDSLSVFTIDQTSGVLSQVGSPVTTGDGPYAVTVDPTGRYVYVANQASDNLSAYTIDSGSGALTEFTNSPVAGGNAPVSLEVDPTGRFLYSANASLTNGTYRVSGYAIDANSGALTELTGSPYDTGNGYSPISIAVEPLGKFVYVANLSSNNIKAFSVNTDTGVLTAGSSFSTGIDPQSLAIDLSGRYVYTANGTSQDVSAFTVNASSGALSTISGWPIATGGNGPISITTTAAIQ